MEDGEMRAKLASASGFILILIASAITGVQAKNLKDVEITDTFPVDRCADNPGLVTSCFGADCNQYLPLIVGRVWELNNENCEDCDEAEAVAVSILSDTELVGGELTRVMEEREWVEDELAEVSRNFLNQCPNTQDIYYWGEDVCVSEDNEDALEEAPYTDHVDCSAIDASLTYGPGAWRAGIGDAEPGVLFPGGAFLLGARYFQEVAEKAQDWATNEEVGLSGAGFEDCVLVLDRNLLEDPKSKEADEKVYCPGIGIVQDEELELTSCTDSGGDCSQ